MIENLASLLMHRGWMLATAESCTGGMVAARCTDLAGSSQWFERGMVSYSNEAKHELLGVDTALIERHGAVSEEVAREMAIGALLAAKADYALSISGIAGPGGAVAARGEAARHGAARRSSSSGATAHTRGTRRADRRAASRRSRRIRCPSAAARPARLVADPGNFA